MDTLSCSYKISHFPAYPLPFPSQIHKVTLNSNCIGGRGDFPLTRKTNQLRPGAMTCLDKGCRGAHSRTQFHTMPRLQREAQVTRPVCTQLGAGVLLPLTVKVTISLSLRLQKRAAKPETLLGNRLPTQRTQRPDRFRVQFFPSRFIKEFLSALQGSKQGGTANPG